MNPWEPKANNIDTATNSTNFSCEAGREAGEGSCVEREDQYEGEEGGGGEGVGGEEVEEVLVLLSLLFAE
jgi:hypothetical protein